MTIHDRTALAGSLVGAVLVTLAVPQAQNSAGQRIPLREGLTIVTALNEPEKGDYESLKVIIEANSKAVRLKYSAEVPAPAGGDDNPFAAILGGGKAQTTKKADGSEVRRVNTTRTVARQDLDTAVDYRWHYFNNAPESFPGSTAVGVSRRVLNDLKVKGEAALRVPEGGIVGALGNLLGGILGAASPDADPGTMLSGTLKRVDPHPVPFKVIVNDEPTELPAVHARGRLGEDDAQFWILDDPDNPLALKWELGDARLQVIRLAFPADVDRTTTTGGGPPLAAGGGKGSGGSGAATGTGGGPGGAASGTAKRIEEDLTKEGRAVVYGIYFDFASDRIKDESEPVLAEIAQVLRQNPTWSLNVEGHTDSIGGDSYNLGLSERRSAAVKQALATRHKIDATRLQTSGLGASRPKDRNDTIEGRARNRRVELVKASD